LDNSIDDIRFGKKTTPEGVERSERKTKTKVVRREGPKQQSRVKGDSKNRGSENLLGGGYLKVSLKEKKKRAHKFQRKGAGKRFGELRKKPEEAQTVFWGVQPSPVKGRT